VVAAEPGAGAGDVPLSVLRSGAAPGELRVCQAWYRNSADFCTASSSNLTNAFEVRWGS
jgi:hypothetical protein